MTRYRIKKVGRVGENNSYFGDIQKYFEGFATHPPTIGERFVLWHNKLGDVIINTSPIVEITDELLYTTYSVYKYEKIN